MNTTRINAGHSLWKNICFLIPFFFCSAVFAVDICVVADNTPINNDCINLPQLDMKLREVALKNGGRLSENVSVNLGAGVYRLKSPVTVNADYLSDGSYSFKITANKDSLLRITGSIPVNNFKIAQITAGISSNAAGKIYVASFSELAPDFYPEFSDRRFGQKVSPIDIDLSFKRKAMPIARWPNNGYGRLIVKKDTPDAFMVNGLALSKYQFDKTIRVGGYWGNDWAAETLAVNMGAGNTLFYFQNSKPTYPMVNNQRVWIENSLADLDAPGEWSVDYKNKLIYFWPPSVISQGDVEISIAKSAFIFNQVKNFTIENINIDSFLGNALELNNVDVATAKNITVTNVGNTGIVLSGRRSKIQDSRVEGAGSSGMSIQGGDRKLLTEGRLLIQNATIKNVGRFYRTYNPNVSIAGVGNSLIGSVLSDSPHSAIIFSGNNHLIQSNTIFNVVNETDDAGAIYTGRDWTSRGTVIERNHFYAIGDYSGAAYGAKGVYLDDQASGTTVRRNVFEGLGQSVFIGGGRDNSIVENLFLNSKAAIVIDARGMTWQKDASLAPTGIFQKNLHTFNVFNQPYSQQYPNLGVLLEDGVGLPKYNILKSNIFCASGNYKIQLIAKPYISITNSLTPTANSYCNDSNSKAIFLNGTSLDAFKSMPDAVVYY